MKMEIKPYVNSFLWFSTALFFTSCVVVTEEEYSSVPPDNDIFEVSPADLTLNYEPLDVFFFNTVNNNYYTGIKNGVEVQLTSILNTEVDIPEATYGFYTYAESVINVNARYDLIKGRMSKFLSPQEITIDGHPYSIEGFNEETSGEYLLFDKQTYEFIELEDGFTINNSLYNPIQVIDNKLYYLNLNAQGTMSEIKYLNLDNINASPTTVYTGEYILQFLINPEMEMYARSGSSNDKFVNLNTGNVREYTDLNNPLSSYFIGVDGGFYAQNHFGAISQPVRGFYSMVPQGATVISTPLFTFNSADYPGISYLGNSDIVVPNTMRDRDLIISTNTGVGSMYIYEFNSDLGTIDPVDVQLIDPLTAAYHDDQFLVMQDYDFANNSYRLRKIDLSNYNTAATILLGRLQNGVGINQNSGSIFSLRNENNVSTFIELNRNNSITEIELTSDQYGYFSVIQ